MEEFPYFDYDNEYGEGKFTQTGTAMDVILENAATNMKINRNLDVETSDLRELLNSTMVANSLYGMHQLNKGNLQETGCEMTPSMQGTILSAINIAQQTQGREQ